MKTGTIVSPRRAFTLLEILIVVALLGILGAIVIPQFRDTTDEATESSVRAQLQRVRAAIEYYRARNQGRNPLSIELLVDQDYLQAMPDHPGDLEYEYVPATGEYHSPLDVTW